MLLPDFLALVFTANEQSFEGALAIAASAQSERRRLSVQRPPLTILPLLSRFDGRDEIDESEKWLGRFASGLTPMYADWLPKQYQPRRMLELTKVPYVTRFSFGEPLPVLTHSLTDPELPGFYLENCARLLASDFGEAARIIDPAALHSQTLAEQLGPLVQEASTDEQEAIDEQDLNRLLRARAEEALTVDEQSFGPNHPKVAIRLNNLALLLQAANRLAEAEPLMRRALIVLLRFKHATGDTFGGTHPQIKHVLDNYRDVLRAMALTQAEAAERLTRAAAEAGYDDSAFAELKEMQ